MNGWIDDITPYLSGSKIKQSNYNPALWDASDINSGHFGIPLNMTAMIMFVNMDLYEKYGQSAPAVCRTFHVKYNNRPAMKELLRKNYGEGR
jgi:ABC-type glycerol-3-phosphate transport system substrate-binding protein